MGFLTANSVPSILQVHCPRNSLLDITSPPLTVTLPDSSQCCTIHAWDTHHHHLPQFTSNPVSSSLTVTGVWSGRRLASWFGAARANEEKKAKNSSDFHDCWWERILLDTVNREISHSRNEGGLYIMSAVSLAPRSSSHFRLKSLIPLPPKWSRPMLGFRRQDSRFEFLW